MPRQLRASRYLRDGNASLARYIADELWDLDLEETLDFYRYFHSLDPWPADKALLACNDRYYLLTQLCGRKDAIHPWVFARCREVEAQPDGYLDLWFRGGFKSSIITFAGILQETLINSDLTVAIFSFNKQAATAFLKQIKRECEANGDLKQAFADVLWERPASQAPKWSEAEGLVFKRRGNPKESTIEAHSLIDAMPTGKHFQLMVYDDVIERKSVTNDEMVKKATEGWELSQNLGVGELTRRWHIGTRYTWHDTYGKLLERKILKPRVHPATDTGTLNGKPVYFSQAHWNKIKIDQRSTVAAQMLQNPSEGLDKTFQVKWLRPYELVPEFLNVAILCDPAMALTKSADRTAIAVIGRDPAGNYYLLDGVRHRMNLTQRFEMLKMLHNKWSDHPGVQSVRVGYEKYGMQADINYVEERMSKEITDRYRFVPEEVNWVRGATDQSKNHRIGRLQPPLERSHFFLPWFIWRESLGECSWRLDDKGTNIAYKPARIDQRDDIGPEYADTTYGNLWLTKRQRDEASKHKAWRVPNAIKRLNEAGAIYDVGAAFIEEAMMHPFGTHDDLLDACSRVFDIGEGRGLAPAVQLDQLEPEFPNYPDA